MQTFNILCDKRITCDGVEDVECVALFSSVRNVAPFCAVGVVRGDSRFRADADCFAGQDEGGRVGQNV